MINKRVGLYIEVLKSPEKTGIGRYIEGLVKSLSKQSGNTTMYFLYYQAPLLNAGKTFFEFEASNVHMRPVRFPSNWMNERPRLWWDYYLPFVLERDKIDVFHGPNHFIPSRGKFKKVVTIHDIAYFFMEVHGKGMDAVLKDWTLKSFASADKVISVSKSTANDCIENGLEPSKSVTIYQGYESSFEFLKLDDADVAKTVDELKLPKSCILFLGSMQPRKNVSLLVNAFALISSQIESTLVLAGGPGSSQVELEVLIKENDLNERVIFTGYVSDEQRAALYQHCEIFVYPSKYEGFGLVLLEAMSFGIPVVTCNNSSLPEVVGDAGIMIKDNDIKALSETLLRLLENDDLKYDLREKGLAQCKKFTWEDCAQLTQSVYEEC